MKKLFFFDYLVVLCSNFYSQSSQPMPCRTDQIMKNYYQEFLKQKSEDDSFNLELFKLIKNGKLVSKLNKIKCMKFPTVVHAIGDGSPLGSQSNMSDADIIT